MITVNRFVWIFTISLILFLNCNQIKNDTLDHVIDYSIAQLLETVRTSPENQYPLRTKGDGPWEFREPSYWTSGFFPGCLWLAYELKPDTTLLNHAIHFTEGLEEQQFNTSHHDIGFMMLNSYGNGYRLTDTSEYKEIILQSAASLASRYNENVKCIQSWNGPYQVIIDNMMNLELLFWAAKNGGDKKFYDIAVNHAKKTIQHHLREDGTAFHVVVYDTITGKVIRKRTEQGYADASCWARGQAWGIYGFTMAFRETGDSLFLNTAIQMAEYFIANLPDDTIPFWDFNLPKDTDRPFKDASAAMIACSGLLELRLYVNESEKYDRIIKNMMNSLIKKYLSKGTNSAGIILHCAYNANRDNPYDRDASTIWGDYYFLESLIRFKKANF